MIETLMPLIKNFMPFAQKRMKFSEPPRLFLKGDSENAENPLGKTAHYDPGGKSITIYITGRHPKDVLRSLSHELVHHAQCCRGDLDGEQETGLGYAQNDKHMREMEREAYEVGNMCFRDWEDGIKSTIYFEHLQKGAKTMSTKDWKNKEMGTLLSEAWGFGFKLNESEQNEGKSHDCSNHVKENATGREGRCINHTLTENSEVTHYTVEFDDEIVENIPVSELTKLDELVHSHAGKRDDYEHDKKKPRREHQTADGEPLEEEEAVEESADGGWYGPGDGNTYSSRGGAHDEAAINKRIEAKKKKKEKEEEEANLARGEWQAMEERRGRGRADPRIQRAPDNRARPLEEEEDVEDEPTNRDATQSHVYRSDADKIVKGITGDDGVNEQTLEEEEEEIEERRGRGREDRHTRTPDNRLRENIKDIIRQALRAEGNKTNGQER